MARLFIPFMGYTAIAVLLGGCSLMPEMAEDEQPPAWQVYDDEAAQTFIAGCQNDLDLAATHTTALATTTAEIPDLALLGELNQVQVILDARGGRSELFQHVHPNELVRRAASLCQKHVNAFETELHLSRNIYQRLRKVESEALSDIDRAYLQELMRTLERAGVAKSAKTRSRIRQLRREILAIEQEFSRNLRQDVRSVTVDPTLLTGLPKDFIDAHTVNPQGLVTLTTEYPDYYPVMQYAHSDKLRKKLFQQFRSRGYPQNEAVLASLLRKREQLAQLLGYAHFADYITADKMIGSAKNAAEFIDTIASLAEPRAEQDYQALLKRLRQIDPQAAKVGEWQKLYLENSVRSEIYDVDTQQLRRYFAYDKVKTGLFALVQDLFGVNIRAWDTEVWHPSVEAYEILQGEKLLGQFYLDMHPRQGKYQHAAHFGVREGVAGIQTPVSALVANFPGGADEIGYMEHKQVETFVHEFGHLLHSMFGGHQPWLLLSGINTERDFVEVPAQMLEQWVWDVNTLQTFATNERGETIPEDLTTKMRAGRNFGKGLYIRHQLFYAALSLAYHQRDPQQLDLLHTLTELQQQYSPFDYAENTYLYANFGHLNSYSALYYSYMWSQVIAADLFSEFEEAGLRNKDLAERFRQTVLAPGGAKPAAQLVEDFLGRPYNFEAFARRLNEAN